MPITPFHFGPGILIKSASPRKISWAMFTLANVAIDLEPIVYFVLTGDPAHRHLHTYLGAGLLAVACALLGRRLCEKLLVFWNSRLDQAQTLWLAVETSIPLRMALISALLGTWSHVFLDSVMHTDIQPAWPFSHVNPLRWVWPMDFLHIWCVMLGVWGILRLLTARWDVVRKDTLDGLLQPTGLRITAEQLARKTVAVIGAAIGFFCVISPLAIPHEAWIRPRMQVASGYHERDATKNSDTNSKGGGRTRPLTLLPRKISPISTKTQTRK